MSVSGQLLCFRFLWALLNMDDLGKLLFFHNTERETLLGWNMEIIVIQALFKFYYFFKVFGEFGTSDVLKPPLLEIKIYTEPKKTQQTSLCGPE